MTPIAYDAGALVAADRGDRTLWARHRVWVERGTVPAVPAPALAQVSRSPGQTQLRRLLRGCDVVALDERSAHAVGGLLADSETTDVVDAAVVVAARALSASVLTSDRHDIAHLVAASGARIDILDV